MKYVAPSVHETAFNCPNCHALAKQTWLNVFVDPRHESEPLHYDRSKDSEIRRALKLFSSEPKSLNWIALRQKLISGIPFIEELEEPAIARNKLWHINLSECFHCKNLAVWVHDRLVHPQLSTAPHANPDMPDDIRRDYDEASSILNLSPRGAAALVRLAIQKLCKELGRPGKNLSDDIGALVKNGLDARVQRALDVVRVMGNSAVHPGQIDLSDDRETATTLLKLLNYIVEKTISEAKLVDELFESLPENKKQEIERRDR